MIVLQILIGLFFAVGIGYILADLLKVPSMKATKAASNLGRKGDTVNMIENEYYETRDQMISEYDYDVIHYSGELATRKEMIAVYAVKLNLDTENPTNLATFDEEKADALRQVFWDINHIQIYTEVVDEVRSTTFVDEDGNVSTVETMVEIVHLYVNTEITSIVKLCEIYGFSELQREMLAELMSDENDRMWGGEYLLRTR